MRSREISQAAAGSSRRVLLKPRDMARRPKQPVKVLGDVIEISSDEELQPPPPQPALADLRRQVDVLNDENAKLKRDLTEMQEQLAKSTPAPRHNANQLILNLSQFDDCISCDICSGRLWSPFILPDCGHAFCQSCLQDWFGQTHAQFMDAHPLFNPNDGVQHVHNVFLGQNPRLTTSKAPQPEYTCPSCREPVNSRPVEDFTLKALIHALTAAIGENSPKTSLLDIRRRGKGSVTSGPWDGFFPRLSRN